jgi:uncharacterized membrane protein YhfC
MDELVRVLNGLLMVAAPLVLGMFLTRRFRMGWRLFLVGCVTFVASQVVHIPFNSRVLAPALETAGLAQASQGLPLILLALAYGLSAGLFEEGARFLVYRFWIKDARSWKQGLIFGAGHGGAEAIILGALALYAFFQLSALRGVDLATVLPAEQVELGRAQVESYWAVPWHLALAGAVERVLALCVQTSLAVLVLQAFVRRNLVWLAGAMGWHTVVDALAVVGVVRGWSVYTIEGVVAIAAVLSGGAILLLKPKGDEPSAEHPAGPELRQIDRTERPLAEVPPERLDDSRFSG